MNIRQRADQIHLGDSFRGFLMTWTVDTFYTTLARDDLSNGKNGSTRSVVGSWYNSLTAPLLLLLLGLLEPWTQLQHSLDSSPFHHNGPPALLYPLAKLMHSN
jgi:hypothetical protein